MGRTLLTVVSVALVLSVVSTIGALLLTSSIDVPSHRERSGAASSTAGPPPSAVPRAAESLAAIARAVNSSSVQRLKASSAVSRLQKQLSTLASAKARAAETLGKLQDVAQTLVGSGGCKDTNLGCAQWASDGECTANPSYMLEECAASCGKCKTSAPRSAIKADCNDKSSYCGQWAAVGECDSNPNYMRHNCPVTCHLCQSTACHDVDPTRCASAALEGECRRSPEKMYDECRWACKWCAMSHNSRCVRPKDSVPAATRGTVEYMFARAAVHSHLRPRVLLCKPWVILFEDFLSPDEERCMTVT